MLPSWVNDNTQTSFLIGCYVQLCLCHLLQRSFILHPPSFVLLPLQVACTYMGNYVWMSEGNELYCEGIVSSERTEKKLFDLWMSKGGRSLAKMFWVRILRIQYSGAKVYVHGRHDDPLCTCILLMKPILLESFVIAVFVTYDSSHDLAYPTRHLDVGVTM